MRTGRAISPRCRKSHKRQCVMPLDNRTCFTVNLRDGLCCLNCGKAPAGEEGYHRGFEYHHVVPRSEGGADTPDNIALLCHECHLDGHRGRMDLGEKAKNWRLNPPERFPCNACTDTLVVNKVEMNCGWYLCRHCGVKTHLWHHFFSRAPHVPQKE
ncbi:MAG: hypothetical protein DI626_03410 [Micavibrio aeruginosavorus]|uniref:HNH nuclease domain-containing protein n=1 Tax=Micavibrio aeruginosavorus TaxID=349221 RepID=A0A2W5A365_9BACT|nr:MAG: hypothetical protein DI626_03410 [Micavibrio aeruginosavorus]